MAMNFNVLPFLSRSYDCDSHTLLSEICFILTRDFSSFSFNHYLLVMIIYSYHYLVHVIVCFDHYLRFHSFTFIIIQFISLSILLSLSTFRHHQPSLCTQSIYQHLPLALCLLNREEKQEAREAEGGVSREVEVTIVCLFWTQILPSARRRP